MAPPIPIPADVRLWLSGVFAGCNERVASTMTQVPTIHEVPLDMTFIQHFLGVSAPRRFPSGWSVEISTHYLGGGRHYGEWGDWPRRWEIADIGLLVVYRQGGKVLRSKVALLQSKRLYPDEQPFDEDTPIEYMAGFGRLFHSDEDWAAITEPRIFNFTEGSRYRALLTGVTQYNAIASYERQRNVPVYYLLYNPRQIPSSASVPITDVSEPSGACDVGCRVVPALQLRTALAGQPDGHSPAYEELRASLGEPFAPEVHPAGWRLEHFVADLLLDCKTGYIAESRSDGGLNYIFNRRTGPIAAALAVTLDAPV
ncbi:hypothetical protein [Asanoa iriomotensis]|uniref:Uncharacterized protein n=1 Tax=Asanoa iriomotensis TaxID=234613 RepID=A0ABQ4CGB3_9ACTN|nr:hypothetical protein [Asanoa iriomotensis]GIF61806.1 hypothetical protein Air01nite_79010 [Asanoa iriomotensis]